MNVLIFVTSTLMLLAMMTYGRLESFRSDSIAQVKFKQSMECDERDYLNRCAEERYSNTVATKADKKNEDKNESSPALSKLNFALFVDPQVRRQNQHRLEGQLQVAQHLIAFLYGDQQFYKDLKQKRPDFVNEMLVALMEQSEILPNIQKVDEIATIDLKDPLLNQAFTRMLIGNHPGGNKRPLKLTQGDYSLLDFITINQNKFELRVFLASRQILMAIYGSTSLVEEITALRYQLFKSVKNNAMTPAQAKEAFRQAFEGAALPFVPVNFLNFDVTKTNPQQYI